MKSFGWILCGTVICWFGLGQGEALAQFQDPNSPQLPGLSPYMNLFRRGSNPALNYFDIVRPQLQNQSNFQTLQQQQNLIQQQLLRQRSPTPAGQATRNVPGYMTHGKYFMQGGTIAAGTGQTRKGINDRRVGTVGTAGTGTPQTRSVIQPNNFTRPLIPLNSAVTPSNPSVTPFNPYRGF